MKTSAVNVLEKRWLGAYNVTEVLIADGIWLQSYKNEQLIIVFNYLWIYLTTWNPPTLFPEAYLSLGQVSIQRYHKF